jgi:hypothetical protein
MSTDAAVDFPNNFAHAIFVDGLHTYEGVKNDIELWTNKSREGGVIIFNDYSRSKNTLFPGVAKAVDEYTKERGLKLHVGAKGSGPGVSNAYFEVPNSKQFAPRQ